MSQWYLIFDTIVLSKSTGVLQNLSITKKNQDGFFIFPDLMLNCALKSEHNP